METTQKKIGMIIIIGILLSIAGITYIGNDNDNEIEYRPCIDKYGNEFVDEVCEKKIYSLATEIILIIIIPLIFITSISLFLFIIMSIENLKKRGDGKNVSNKRT